MPASCHFPELFRPGSSPYSSTMFVPVQVDAFCRDSRTKITNQIDQPAANNNNMISRSGLPRPTTRPGKSGASAHSSVRRALVGPEKNNIEALHNAASRLTTSLRVLAPNFQIEKELRMQCSMKSWNGGAYALRNEAGRRIFGHSSQ